MMTYFLLGRAVSPTHSETNPSVCSTKIEYVHSVGTSTKAELEKETLVQQSSEISVDAAHDPQPSAEPEKRKREEEHTVLF